MKKYVPFILILVLALAACGGLVAPTGVAATPGEGGPTDEPLTEAGEPLPPEVQTIPFQASDGESLTGLYYPAATNPAPVVVFMHWVGGNESDWYEIAPWLQNRAQTNPFTNPGTEAWWDPTWFPTVSVDDSFGVFIFSFRTCTPYDTGCPGWMPEQWLLDAQAAMQTAASLEGADPTRIVAIGSSVGADGAPDACAWLNEQTPGSCQGALSLSPGGYMNIPYTEVVTTLGSYAPPVAAWCLADENEFGICQAAETAGNSAYRDFQVTGGSHGNRLLRPALDPLPMQIILDFLAETVAP